MIGEGWQWGAQRTDRWRFAGGSAMLSRWS
jgi:hypothetical protein